MRLFYKMTGMNIYRASGLSLIFLGTLSAVWFLMSTNDDLWLLSEEVNRITYNPGASYAVHRVIPKEFKGKELEFHQIFEPRIVSFDGYPKNRKAKDSSIKTILLWTPWNGVTKTINYYFLRPGNVSFVSYSCPNSRCVVTSNKSQLSKADAVLFNIRDMKKSDLISRPTSNPNQIWIGYILEAPWLCKLQWNMFDGLFNWTMSYREDSDVIVKYGFVGKQSKGEPKAESSNENVPFAERKSVVWFVSDCHTDSRREDYVNELKKHIDVDVYGKCGDKKCFPAQSSICYGDVLVKYKYYLSFENSICEDYVTEKFFNILEYDVVPVVFGGAAYEKLAPKNSFIDATLFPRPEDLARHLAEASATEERYRTHFRWKMSHRAYLHPWTCHLCDKLHQPILSYSPGKTNLKKWWIDDAHCRRWTNSNYYPVE